MLKKYVSILSQRNFFLLWIGQVVSQFGDRLTQIALVGLVSQQSLSSSRLALVMSMAIIPVFIVSPICGVYVDRWSKRTTMYLSDLARGVLIILVPLLYARFHTIIPIYLLIFLSFSAGRFFIPAKMAFLPEIVPKQQIFLANSLVSVTATVAAILGFGLGGVIFERWGMTVAFLLDALTFFISALTVYLIVVKEKSSFAAHDILAIGKDVFHTVQRSFLTEFKEGITYIFKSEETKYVFGMFFFLFAYVGGLYVVFIRFLQEVLATVTKDIGFVAVSLGAGIFLGSLAYGRIAHKLSVKKVLNASMFLSSVYLVAFAVGIRRFPHSGAAIVLAWGLGALISPVFVGLNSLIHHQSDEKLLGRIFSSLEFTSHVGFIIFMFIASLLADLLSPFTIVVSIGIIGTLGSLLFLTAHVKTERAQRSSAGACERKIPVA